MPDFTDPATGRRYEVGPDGTSRWIESGEGGSKRPWYRRAAVVAAATGVGGLLIGTALGGAGSSAAPSASPTSGTPTTTTTTATVTASAVPLPAVTTTQTVQATRTVKVTSKPRTVTVTKTATTQDFVGGGGGGGGAVYYANCTEARAAGDTPLYVGDPGYRRALDRDGDGVACE
jgi:excalibur calcium-binding domain-containing protein